MYREPYGDQEPGQAYYEDVPPDHTQPYSPQHASLRLSEPPPPRHRIPALALGAYLVGIAGVLLAAFCIWQLTSVKSTADGLQSTVSQQAADIATMHKALVAAQQTAGSYTNLPTKVTNLQNKLANLTPYNQECSAPVTGPSGNPVQGFFRCSLAHQG
jgi:hypothetical protein